jgi:hypothetical protein
MGPGRGVPRMSARTWWAGRWEHLKWGARDALARLAGALERIGEDLRKAWRELATVALGLTGWGLLTDVVAQFLGTVVWEVSLGLLCLSLFGWKLAFTVARDGVYALSKRAAKP